MRGVAKTPNYTLEGAINVNQKVVVGRRGGEIVLVYMAVFLNLCLKKERRVRSNVFFFAGYEQSQVFFVESIIY